jgi:hypothetical protein
MQNPEWRARYRDRLRELLPLFDPPSKLQERVQYLSKRLQPVLRRIDPQLALDHAERVKEFNDRLAARAESLRDQVDREDPKPPEFDENGNMPLADWYGASESEDAVLEEVELPKERRAYSIQCGPSGQCVASWRRRVLLGKGSYTFHAMVKTKKVATIDDEKGSGAGLRISGANRTNGLDGTSKWQPLEYEFSIDEDQREVELVAELRTTRGHAWFDLDSLRLSRKQEVAMPTQE